MTSTAALELRRLDRTEVRPLLPQLSEWLVPGALYGVEHTWPQLYRGDGDGRFVGLFHDGRLTSHCAWRFASARTAHGVLPIALLGSVVTDPHERGRGHASRLLSHAVDDCRSHGMAAILLWAERPELYRRAGFIAGTTEQCLVIAQDHVAATTSIAGEQVRLATVADHARLLELHSRKPIGIDRAPRVMSCLLTTPGMWTCVLERDGNVLAYACVGKGADLQNWWHEFGGADADVATLLPRAMALVEQPQSIVLLPPYRARLAQWLLPQTIETATVAGPMIRAIDDAPLPPFWIDGLDSV